MSMSNFKEIFLESLQSRWESLAKLLPEIIAAAAVFLLFFALAMTLRSIFRRTMKRRTDDRLLGNFLSNIVYWLVLLVGLSVCMKIVGLGGVAGGLVAGAGVSAFVIGFAFKDIGENFLAGILMAFSRPFRVGDTVDINGVVGSVQTLDLRNTHLKTPDGKDVYIPNGSVIKNNLFNFTIDGFLRHDIVIGIDQDEDYDEAIDILQRTIEQVDGVLQGERKPVVMISGTDVNSVLIKAFYWIDTFDKSIPVHRIKTEVLGRSIKALVAAGFYLPNTVIELKNYNDSSLAGSAVR